MKAENIFPDKSFAFSFRILKLYLFLRTKKVDAGPCSQILDSGTAAYKEARETKYWLRLLKEGELIDKKLADPFPNDCEEILKILTAILNSSKEGTK